MKVRISKRKVKEIIAYVEEQGRSRQKIQGSNFNDVDFAMGAASVFYALELNDYVPVKWIFNPMANRAIFGKESDG